MKLFVINSNNQKVYLNIAASTRNELRNLIGGAYFNLGGENYSVHKVYAEAISNNTGTGAVVGGAIGALGGPIGILAGAVLGGLIGNGSDNDENVKVQKFNSSTW